MICDSWLMRLLAGLKSAHPFDFRQSIADRSATFCLWGPTSLVVCPLRGGRFGVFWSLLRSCIRRHVKECRPVVLIDLSILITIVCPSSCFEFCLASGLRPSSNAVGRSPISGFHKVNTKRLRLIPSSRRLLLIDKASIRTGLCDKLLMKIRKSLGLFFQIGLLLRLVGAQQWGFVVRF